MRAGQPLPGRVGREELAHLGLVGAGPGVARAQAALKASQERLAAADSEEKVDAALAAVRRAETRIDVAQKG